MTPPANAALRLRVEPYESADVQRLVQEQRRELTSRYTTPGAPPPLATDFVEPQGVFLAGRVDGEPITIGGIRRLAGSTAEIRRMYTVPAHRQRGHGRALLLELERHAWRLRYTAIRLETGHNQPDAVALYSAAGYVVIPCYGEFNDGDSIFMEKQVNSRGFS